MSPDRARTPVIVDGLRTPFGRYGGALKDVRPDDMAAHVIRVPSLAVVGAADPALPRVKAMQGVWAGLEVVVLPGATHPTVHPRSLPRHAAFREAIRGHIARAQHRPHI